MPTGSFDYGSADSAERGNRSMVGPGQGSQPKSNAPGGAWSNTPAFTPSPSPTPGISPPASPYSAPPGRLTQQIGGLGSQAANFFQSAGAASLSGNLPGSLYGPQQIVNSIYGPQQQILQDQLARQQAQLGMIGTDTQYRTGALQRDNALAQQALGLDKQALGIEKGLTQGQLGNLGKLKDILKKQYGLTDRTLATTLNQLGIDEATLRDMAKRKTFDLRSDLTQRGAFNTIANERGTGRIQRDLTYGLGGINNQRSQAQIQYEGNRLGLDEKGIGYDNQALGLNARLANLGLDSQRLGISEQQLANSLQDGLYQIGLGSMTSINSLLDAMGGTNAQQAQLAATILGEVANYSQLPPNVLAAIQAALAGGGGTSKSTNRKQGPGAPL